MLEAGCGVGAQTVTLARNSPEAHITSIDVSETSLAAAAAAVRAAGITNVTLRQADIFALPFPDASFDHVFVCFVLEHLAAPVDALLRLQAVLKPGGTITVIEGDHGSAYFHPRSRGRSRDPLPGRLAGARPRRLADRPGSYPLRQQRWLRGVQVSPRMVYVDASRPRPGRGVHQADLHRDGRGRARPGDCRGMMTAEEFDAGIGRLYRTAEADGTFCYTFFKATAVNG